MKKILVIDESPLVRDYLTTTLNQYGFKVLSAMNGLDGMNKMRSSQPDLVIMDWFITRKNVVEFLQEKKRDPNIARIPVVLVMRQVEKRKILELKNLNIARMLMKPIKIDLLLKAVSELTNVEVSVDPTPCILEAHLNENILFIEVAMGLNMEKILLLRYRIYELLKIYKTQTPKVLIMMSDIEVAEDNIGKMHLFMRVILDATETAHRFIKILSLSATVREYVESHTEFDKIYVVKKLEIAMDELLDVKDVEEYNRTPLHEKIIYSRDGDNTEDSHLHMKFQEEKIKEADKSEEANPPAPIRNDYSITIVDDDFVVQELMSNAFEKNGWDTTSFDNGKLFMDYIDEVEADLIFLDIMMPEMDGFEVLALLKERNFNTPIIVLSALSQKETVAKAMGLGVKSYLIKPLKPTAIMQKAAEILTSNF